MRFIENEGITSGKETDDLHGATEGRRDGHMRVDVLVFPVLADDVIVEVEQDRIAHRMSHHHDLLVRVVAIRHLDGCFEKSVIIAELVCDGLFQEKHPRGAFRQSYGAPITSLPRL